MKSPPSLVELRVEILADQAARVEAVLSELESCEWHMTEDREPGGRAWLKGIFSDKPAARAAWKQLRAALPPRVSALKPDLRSLRDIDWREAYKAHFKASSYGGLHWVPVWQRETFAAPAGEAVVLLDPGMAFGTGNHETTRLCAERLVDHARELRSKRADLSRLSVLDVGCGSGILAISAAKLGFGRVYAFDVDQEAVRVAAENVALNGVGDVVEVAHHDVAAALPRRKADLVLANLQTDLLLEARERLLGAVKPGGGLVLSGILAPESAATRTTFVNGHTRWKASAHTLGEWADIYLLAPK